MGLVLTVIAGAALDWYPSRIGGPAYWLDDQLYRPVLDRLAASPNPLEVAGFLYLVALIASFTGYWLAFRWARALGAGQRRHLLLAIGTQLALCLWLAVQPYLSSQDIFSYAFYSHIFAWYHDNPYVAIPRDYPYDPFFSAIFWKDQPSNYGPLWTYLSALAPLIAGSAVGPTLLALKALPISACVASTGVLWSLLGRLRPERRLSGTLLYAWNPLLLIESAEAGHNDAVMALFLVASVWLWTRRRRTAALGALVVALLVKYVVVVLIPLFLIAWWRETGESPVRIIGRASVIGVLVAAIGFGPVFAGPATFGVVGFGSNALAYTNSLLELVFRQMRIWLGDPPPLADLPMHYDGHWVGSLASGILWSAPDEQRGIGILLPADTPLLEVEPETGSWIHVYEPKLGRFGFIRASAVHPIPVPTVSVVPGTTAAVLAGVSQDPIAQQANAIVRLASLLLFLPWYGISCWRMVLQAEDATALLRISVSVLVVYLIGVQSWFWPWYLAWILPFAAIVPEATGATILLAMTATAGLLNAQPSVTPPPFLEWLYGSRVLLIFGLPLLVGAGWGWLQACQRRPTSVRVWLPGCGTPRRGGSGPRLAAFSGQEARRQMVRVALATAAAALLLMLVAGEAIGPGKAARTRAITWQHSFDEALRLYSAGDYGRAVRELTAVLAVQPEQRAVLQLRIAANLQLGHDAQTIPDLTALIRQDPANVELYLQRGVMYARIQRADRALEDFYRVMALAPRNPAGYEKAGLVAYQAGDLATAYELLSHALARSPHDGQIARELADVVASQNRLPAALAIYDQAIAFSPSDARAYADRAAVLLHVGSSNATILDLQQVLVLSDDVQQQQWAARLLTAITRMEDEPNGGAG